MSLNANALVTVAELRDYLGLTSSDSAVALEIIVNSVSQEFEDEVDCDLFSDTYTSEAIDGSGRSYLYLPHWPVTTFTSCVEDGETLVKDTDYFVDMANGILTKSRTPWPTYEYQLNWTTQRGGVVNTYIAGYAAVPADIKLACLKQCAVEYQRMKQKTWGETSRSIGDGSSSYSEPGLLPDVKAVLERYERVEI